MTQRDILNIEVDALLDDTLAPHPGSVAAYADLSAAFDIHLLLTIPAQNAGAWRSIEAKFAAIDHNFGHDATNGIALTHPEHHHEGHYVVDIPRAPDWDRQAGQPLAFGSPDFPTWGVVTEFLLGRAAGSSSAI